MQDQIGIPNCFFSSTADISPENLAAVTKSGQSVFTSIYRTKIISHCRFITVTWCKNVLLHGLSISIEGPDGGPPYTCKLEVKSWKFWRKQGSKRLLIDDDKAVDVYWDLRAARFNGEAEPNSEYYVAIVCDEEVILHLGNLKTEAYRKTNCRPSLIDPILVCRKEHVFGKKRFSSKGKFHEKDKVHEIWIECRGNGELKTEPEMEIKIDGKSVIDVKHLEWKFRGNESITIGSRKVEVYWDVHDWLFSPGLRHALFIFRPVSPSPSSIMTGESESREGEGEVGCSNGSWEFCLFLYAWRVE